MSFHFNVGSIAGYLLLVFCPLTVTKDAWKGQNLSIACSAKSDSKLVATWSKVSGELPRGRSQVLPDGTLNLVNIEEADAGRYVCTTSGDGSEIHSGMQLTVRGEYYVEHYPEYSHSQDCVNKDCKSVMLKYMSTRLLYMNESLLRLPRFRTRREGGAFLVIVVSLPKAQSKCTAVRLCSRKASHCTLTERRPDKVNQFLIVHFSLKSHWHLEDASWIRKN